jgi:hydroxyethylthiazole kinase
MTKVKLPAAELLSRVRAQAPVVHHLTNFVTIYDCANIVKIIGGSPIMAHAPEEVEDIVAISSALVLNIGTLTSDFVEAMKKAARAANKKRIPVVLDVCGAGASRLRDKKCFEILNETKIDIIKGNASEIARINGFAVLTKGVDSGIVDKDLVSLAKSLAQTRDCTVVITGKEDIIVGIGECFIVKNGHALMSRVVGTGCMAASVIAAFAAVEKDLPSAASAGLICFEIAAELAAKGSPGPGAFKERIFDRLYSLDKKTINKMQKVWKK